MTEVVLVRAYGGEALKRGVVHRACGLIYVACLESLYRVARGETHGIGIPKSDIFRFNSDIYEMLVSEKNSEIRNQIWASVTLV